MDKPAIQEEFSFPGNSDVKEDEISFFEDAAGSI
jgi:hypothetical protein